MKDIEDYVSVAILNFDIKWEMDKRTGEQLGASLTDFVCLWIYCIALKAIRITCSKFLDSSKFQFYILGRIHAVQNLYMKYMKQNISYINFAQHIFPLQLCIEKKILNFLILIFVIVNIFRLLSLLAFFAL